MPYKKNVNMCSFICFKCFKTVLCLNSTLYCIAVFCFVFIKRFEKKKDFRVFFFLTPGTD